MLQISCNAHHSYSFSVVQQLYLECLTIDLTFIHIYDTAKKLDSLCDVILLSSLGNICVSWTSSRATDAWRIILTVKTVFLLLCTSSWLKCLPNKWCWHHGPLSFRLVCFLCFCFLVKIHEEFQHHRTMSEENNNNKKKESCNFFHQNKKKEVSVLNGKSLCSSIPKMHASCGSVLYHCVPFLSAESHAWVVQLDVLLSLWWIHKEMHSITK